MTQQHLPATAAAADALLAEFGLPGSAPQEQLRAITRVAATLCGTPTAVVNLLSSCFQHQVGAVGFDGGESDLGDSMCARAISEPSLRYLPDASREPVFRHSPWVDGRMARVRLYASVPLVLTDGRVLGSLCVFSEEPGELDDAQRAGLADLAQQAVTLFEHLRNTRRLEELAGRLRVSEERYRLVAEGTSDIVSLHADDGRLLWVSPSVQRVLGYDPQDEVSVDLVDRVHADDRQQLVEALRHALTDGATQQVLLRHRDAAGRWRWMDTTLTPLPAADGGDRRLHSYARDVTARVAAEQATAESERRYRELVEQSPEAIVFHVDGRLQFANRAAAQLLGATDPQALHGLEIAGFLDPAEHGDLRHRVRAALGGEAVAARRQRMRRLDGRWVWVEISGTRVELDGSAGIRNVIVDVTAQEAAREALRLSEEQHRLFFDAAPVGLVETDPQWQILRVNPAMAAIFGYDGPEAMVGLSATDLAHPSEREAQERVLATTGRDGHDDWDVDRLMLRADGSAIDTAVSGAVLRDAEGRVHRYLATVVDMRERAAARRAMETANRALDAARHTAEAREALLSTILDTIDVGVVACDAEERLTVVNRAALALRAPDEVAPLARALREGEVRHALVDVASPGSAAVATLQCDGRSMRDAHGELLGAVVALKDITDQRAHARQLAMARDAALAATEAKSAFLATVSHEIRTPLHGILGMLELLLANPLDEIQHERARIAHTAGRTLVSLLNDILDLSKGEARQTTLRPRATDPVGLARDVVDTTRGAAQLKGLALELEVRGAVPAAVHADPDRLRQVLLNLLGNAVKFTDTGGVTLTLAAEPPGDLSFTVTDTGPGIDPPDQARLFEPFHQGAAGAAKGGTGLGLALTRQLVELMDGDIAVRSPAAGSDRGTTFTVHLPLPAVAPEPAGPAGAAGPAERPNGRTGGNDHARRPPRGRRRHQPPRRGGAPGAARRLGHGGARRPRGGGAGPPVALRPRPHGPADAGAGRRRRHPRAARRPPHRAPADRRPQRRRRGGAAGVPRRGNGRLPHQARHHRRAAGAARAAPAPARRRLTRRPGTARSVLPSREHGLRLLPGERRLVGDDARRDGLAGHDLLREVHQLRAEERAALHDEVDLPVGQRPHPVADRVDGDDPDVPARLQAGGLDRLDRPESHVVVVRVDDVDVGQRLEERGHDLPAAGTGEVARLRADQRELGVRGGDDLGEAVLAVARGRGAGRPLQLDDVHRAAPARVLLDQPGGGLLALHHEVRPDHGPVERRVAGVDRPVGEDDRDPGVLRLAQHGVPARLHDRRERDDVDLVGDEATDRRDLVLLLLLRVRERQLDAGLPGRLLDRDRVRRAPAALGPDLGEPHRDQAVVAGDPALVAVRTAAAGQAGQRRERHAQRRRGPSPGHSGVSVRRST